MLQKPEPSEWSEAIAALKAFIAEKSYTPGDRLPPERELVSHLGVSRALLRRALDALEREGAIWRHVGKGTFVASPGAVASEGGIAGLIHQLTPVRMMRARLCIEPAIAREAAINASGEAVTRIRLAMGPARRAASWADYEAQDDLFHRSIAEASDNALLLALFDQLNQIRRAVAWETVTRHSSRPPEGHKSFAEHEKIADAIERRDAAAAHDAMRDHIGSVSARLFAEA
ncbi:MAG: FCD domain-containing protein [Hyphomicrobiales bacterium]|nr:FCD domain-containing protein [Hyphomicrobiales bacterium]